MCVDQELHKSLDSGAGIGQALCVKGKFIPGIVVYFYRSVKHILWLPQLLILDLEAPNNLVPTLFFVPILFFSTPVFCEACILARPWTFLLRVFDQRKGRNVTHIYSMPHE